ncbi:MAG: hypothetical protein ACTHKG_20930 [Nocardioides sp.]
MTQPDDRNPDEPGTGSSEAEPSFDLDAEWAQIIANYGDRPVMGSEADPVVEDGGDPPVVEEGAERPSRNHRDPRNPRRPRNLFDRSYIESTTESSSELNSEATWDDEGHFVPPEPPPLPTLEPRRKLAWISLFGAPAMLLLAVVFGWHYPSWLGTLLVLGFVGGFVYLVATMPRNRPGDWGGDDGAGV